MSNGYKWAHSRNCAWPGQSREAAGDCWCWRALFRALLLSPHPWQLLFSLKVRSSLMTARRWMLIPLPLPEAPCLAGGKGGKAGHLGRTG